MHTRLVWPNGFPRGVQLVANEEYQLTIEKLDVFVLDGEAWITVTFLHDGEYVSWCEACSEHQIKAFFLQYLGGSPNWHERTLDWSCYLHRANPLREAENLLEIYQRFLVQMKIPMRQGLIPFAEPRTT